MNSLPISVVIISANSADTVRRCLDSVAMFDDVVVYLNRCTDGTGALCADFANVRVVEGEFLGFGPTRNAAAAHARHPWILAVDTDEWLDARLQQAIRGAALDDPNRAYKMRRPRVLFGKPITVGGVGKHQWVRLYHRDTGRYDDSLVHERVELQPGVRVALLPGKLWHEKERRDREGFGLEAHAYGVPYAQRFPGRKAIHPGLALLRAWATFLKSYLLQGGFLAGWRGILIAHHAAHSVFVKHSAHYVRTRVLDPSPAARDAEP